VNSFLLLAYLQFALEMAAKYSEFLTNERKELTKQKHTNSYHRTALQDSNFLESTTRKALDNLRHKLFF